VDVFVAEQSTAPAPTTARLYRLRFTVATQTISSVASYRYVLAGMWDALGTINVDPTPGAGFGDPWLTVVDLATGLVHYDEFDPPLTRTLCGFTAPLWAFAPWARGVGCPYSRLVCPSCP
jgi:hypothetical protein